MKIPINIPDIDDEEIRAADMFYQKSHLLHHRLMVAFMFNNLKSLFQNLSNQSLR